jgi:hypothetical protein
MEYINRFNSKNLLYEDTESGALKNIVGKNYQFCIAKKEKGKYKYIPLDPQPDASKTVELVRFYTSLKKDYSYKKECLG